MSLRALFAIPIVMILLVTISLSALLAGQGLADQARGRLAIEAVGHMRLLVDLQTALWAERVASNAAVGAPDPMPAPVTDHLASARQATDRAFGRISGQAARKAEPPESVPVIAIPVDFQIRLRTFRATIDELLALERTSRAKSTINTVMPQMLAAVRLLERPLIQASSAVIAADPDLAGLLAIGQLASLQRDTVARIPAILVPPFTAGEALTPADVEKVHVLLAEAAQLTRLLRTMIEDVRLAEAGMAAPVLAALVNLEHDQAFEERIRLNTFMDAGLLGFYDRTDLSASQRLFTPMSERNAALRSAIVDAAGASARARQSGLEHRLNIVLAAFGLILVAILEAIALLHWRVVDPLARLGAAITRIAAGDRGQPLVLKSATREIREMVFAVETLRQAALVADATVTQQREAEQRRVESLREALSIVQTVREPARALETGVARLCEGIDAAIALAVPPQPGLREAATAARLGLAEMRGASAELEATFAATSPSWSDERQEADIVANIMAAIAQIQRRDAAVHGLIKPSLVALRDVTSMAQGIGLPAGLKDLVSDQFHRIETAVAMVASMRSSVARVGTILRDLSLEPAPNAA